MIKTLQYMYVAICVHLAKIPHAHVHAYEWHMSKPHDKRISEHVSMHVCTNATSIDYIKVGGERERAPN